MSGVAAHPKDPILFFAFVPEGDFRKTNRGILKFFAAIVFAHGAENFQTGVARAGFGEAEELLLTESAEHTA